LLDGIRHYIGRNMTNTTTKKLFDSPSKSRLARFKLGEVVKHRVFPFRGVIFDIDPVFNNTDEWWLSIPENVRPSKDQPFYHLFAENGETEYVAYVSEQNLLPDTSGKPIRHPQVSEVFERDDNGRYKPRNAMLN
jgi:heat shock protein HspQ